MRHLRITYSTAYGIRGFTIPVSIEETLRVAEDYALFGFEVEIL